MLDEVAPGAGHGDTLGAARLSGLPGTVGGAAATLEKPASRAASSDAVLAAERVVDDAERRRRRTCQLIVALAALGAAVSAVLLSRFVFPYFSVNNDEPVYVYQARMLLEGRLTLPVGADTAFFRPWMSGQVGRHMVMVFPPVLPALLATAQVLTGTMRSALAVGAAAGVVLASLLAREITGDRRTAVTAAVLLAVCPLFVIQSGLFLSYVLALDLEMGLALLLVRGSKRGQLHWFWAAGVLLGALLFARPLDAVLTGVPLLAVALFRRGPGGRRLLQRAGAVLAGAVPLTLASMLYNTLVTGSPFRLPLHAIGGDDSAGFGVRQLAAGTAPVRYGWHQALTAAHKNLSAVPGWVPGGLVLVGLAIVGLYLHRRHPWAWSLVALTVTVPFGYLFYWGSLLVVQGRRMIGPHYYLALLVPIVVLGAAGLTAVARRWRHVGTALLVVLLAMAGLTLDTRVRVNQRMVALHRRERQLVDSANLHRAIVFLPGDPRDGPWLLHPRPSFMNDPGLRQPVLFAADRAGANFQLVDHFPRWTFYRQFSRAPAGRTTPAPVLWRLDPRSARAFRFHLHAENIEGQPVVTAYVSDGRHSRRISLDRDSRVGRSYDVYVTVSPTAVKVDGGEQTESLDEALAALKGSGTLSLGVGFGNATDLTSSKVTETRYWYRARPHHVVPDQGLVDLMLPGEQWRYRPGVKPAWVSQDVGHAFTAVVEPA
jgi:hypothetical protein